MSGKTFEQYQAEYSREPFAWPMPGGTAVPIAQPSFDTQRAAVAANAAPMGTLMDAIAVYAGAKEDDKGVLQDSENGAQIRQAWGSLPTSALNAVFEDFRKHVGTKN